MNYEKRNRPKRRLKRPVKMALAILLLLIACISILVLQLYIKVPHDNTKEYGDIQTVDTQQEEHGSDYGLQTEPFVVKVFDVGQGSSMLIDYGDMEVLIDGGYYNEKNLHTLLESKNGLSKYVDDGKLEYIISTHSDADHVGCLSEVIQKYDVDKIIYGDLIGDNESVKYFVSAANETGCEFAEDSDTVIHLGKNASITIYDVCDDDFTDINNNSIVTLIQYGETYFFASGDLPAEKEVLLRGRLPKCDVVIAGHHGASDANSLLDELDPDYFVISCGKAAKEGTKQANTYGHPHQEVLAEAISKGAKCFGTFRSGNIVFKSDGMTVSCSAKSDEQLTEEDAGAKQ